MVEVKELQSQVDKLKERLDYMAPMLSLLHFTQDYFQKVECEASVQLLRLKKARAVPSFDGKEGLEPASIDTAKWLHIMTDLVLSLQECSSPKALDAASKGSSTLKSPDASLDSASRRHASPVLPRSPKLAEVDVQKQGFEARHRGEELEVPFKSLAGPSVGQEVVIPRRLSASDVHRSERESRRYESSQPSPRREAPQALSGSSGSRSRGSKSGGYGGDLTSTLEFGGLALGKGTWANAYRQATGSRREALRLLCTSGIVTERELADDLTVISEEHIEECVSIALEMLQRWPAEQGAPPQADGKAFFQERLQALYMKRAPPPFG
eukprot:TRINITY_DN24929_c0_g1_i1.p1 TRINITY_DN24929_c0_g1~~TRINITY_DN24929_c0_g1_i1.p1  ORF type:complete len:357 (-),score=87.98 TRINITY_DN24929_c0_g1_i1:63-1037(-)